MKEEKINPMIEASKEAFKKMYIPDNILQNYTFSFNKRAVKIKKIPKNCKKTILGTSQRQFDIGVNIENNIYIKFSQAGETFIAIISREDGSKLLDMFYQIADNQENNFCKTFKCKNVDAKIIFRKSANWIIIYMSSNDQKGIYINPSVQEIIEVLENIEHFLRPKKATLRSK